MFDVAHQFDSQQSQELIKESWWVRRAQNKNTRNINQSWRKSFHMVYTKMGMIPPELLRYYHARNIN
jgi:hypothetical protein